MKKIVAHIMTIILLLIAIIIMSIFVQSSIDQNFNNLSTTQLISNILICPFIILLLLSLMGLDNSISVYNKELDKKLEKFRDTLLNVENSKLLTINDIMNIILKYMSPLKLIEYIEENIFVVRLEMPDDPEEYFDSLKYKEDFDKKIIYSLLIKHIINGCYDDYIEKNLSKYDTNLVFKFNNIELEFKFKKQTKLDLTIRKYEDDDYTMLFDYNIHKEISEDELNLFKIKYDEVV